MVRNPLWRRRDTADGARHGIETERARVLVEESGEVLVILDENERVLAASPRAKRALPGLEVGGPVPEELHAPAVVRVDYELEGRRESLLKLAEPELAAYEELRSGFTGVVSHELRTPLARLLALLETALLPGADRDELILQARAEVEQIRGLIDEVLFLSELETGREVVSLGMTPALPILKEVLSGLAEAAGRAGVDVRAEGDPGLELPLRPRMLRVVAENLAENAIRYAGQGASFSLSVERPAGGGVLLRGRDDGAGVPEQELARLFERFYRADRARTSRGTGLGLAIAKHIVTSGGGTIEAHGGPGRGVEIRCSFPP